MIRKAERGDLDRLEAIYSDARAFMRSYGNTRQWINGYPQRSLLESDIDKGNLYVIDEDGIKGVFFFEVTDCEPTYGWIDGSWSADRPYAVIHRIAAAKGEKGILDRAISYASGFADYIRIDTHEDNKVMRNALLRRGFRFCGGIVIADGSSRIAFDKVLI